MEFIQDALFCMGLMLHRSMSEMSSISTSMELSNGTNCWHSCLFPTSTTTGRKVQGPEFCFCGVLCCFSLVCMSHSISNYMLGLGCSYEFVHFVMANLCQLHCCFFFFFKVSFCSLVLPAHSLWFFLFESLQFVFIVCGSQHGVEVR